ncbi:MAG: histidinol phosphatase [Candidatus Hydrogenedens sp.]|nr:histidinol phosphatase [Candidatus Hydrogenedens sp.]
MAAIVWTASAGAMAGAPGMSPGRKWTTQARMEAPHLKAATEDAAKYAAAREPVALQSGLNDYRTILHAHAEDSSHTGGTRPEMLADAKKAGVSCIMLTDHFRPPKDFINDSWRGLHDGVLFIPGSETNGFLVYPTESILDKMDLPNEQLIPEVTKNGGLIFLSHLETKYNHPMTGLTGIEAYNRHADAMDDAMALMQLSSVITDPKRYAEFSAALEAYPDAMLATQLDYPTLYMMKWDRDSQEQRVVGVAANDCHHNMVMICKMVDADNVLVGTIVDDDDGMYKFDSANSPGIKEMTQGRQPGDILASLDLDPYYLSFHNESTHVLAGELTEDAIRDALRNGHAYIAHDWMCDPTGFVYGTQQDGTEGLAGLMGDEIAASPTLQLVAEAPVACDYVLIKDGAEVSRAHGREFSYKPDGPGVYRLEAWLNVDTEDRPWIYTNPVYIR